MKYPHLIAGLLLVGALAGCDDAPKRPAPPVPTVYWAHTQGTVRGLDYRNGYVYITIETDDRHALFTVKLEETVPPVWTGLRGRFTYESSNKEAGTWKNFLVLERLPE